MRGLVLASLLAVSCGGTTGDNLVTFSAAAAGPATASADFDSSIGYHVHLNRAVLHIGAVYLNSTVPISGSQELGCIRTDGVYVGEVTLGLDVNLLSPALQPFPTGGEGTTVPAVAAEVWLTGGDVNATTDGTHILDIAGTATRASDQSQFPFQGTITISSNRAIPAPNATMPGANPLCLQRIISPIAAKLMLGSGGTLVVRADPTLILDTIDFSQLTPAQQNPPLYQFMDSSSAGGPSFQLYTRLRYSNVYQLAWEPAPH